MAPTELRLGSIEGSLEERISEWRRRVRSVQTHARPAHDLYIGDHWRAACDAHKLALRYSSRTELWVISAGYGLIASRKPVKPYSATFTSGSLDSIWRGPADGDRQRCLHDWWRALPHDAELADLLEDTDDAIVIAAGAHYITALGTDLATAVHQDESGGSVSVISAGTRTEGPFLPVTAHLRTVVGGTNGALNTRVLRLLATQAASHHWNRRKMDRTLLRLTATSPRLATSPHRRPATDTDIAAEIAAMRNRSPTMSRTAGLRELRNLEIACEQSRFAAIWTRTLTGDGHVNSP